MRALAALAGLELCWKMEKMGGVEETAERTFVLYLGDEPVADAQVMWQRLVYFDVVMESGEGTYHAHMDLTSATRQSVAWKAGLEQSTAGFQVASEGLITADGWITTAGGRPRSPHPTRTATNTPFFRRAGPDWSPRPRRHSR